MQEELTQFNEKTKTKDTLFDELKKIDETKGKPHAQAAEENSELDKRRAIMKGVKQQIERDEKEATLKQQRDQI